MLFRGLRLARAGWRVTFVDAADRIGGGWRTIDAFGLEGVETGVHLFERRASSVAALCSLFAPEELVADLGHGQVGRRRIGLRAARALLYAGLLGKAVRRGSGERAGHALRKLGHSVGPGGLPLLYPAGGVAALLARLEARLLELGAGFRMGERVGRVELIPSGVRLHGAGLDADRLVFSSRAHAPVVGHEALWRRLARSEVANLVMVVPEAALLFEGYAEIFAHDVVKRVRRFGGSRAVIVVQVRTADVSPEQALARLAALGLVRAGTRAEAARLERFGFTTLPTGPALRLARASGGRLEFLRTVDFSDEDHRLP
jgi:hypothetical protein